MSLDGVRCRTDRGSLLFSCCCAGISAHLPWKPAQSSYGTQCHMSPKKLSAEGWFHCGLCSSLLRDPQTNINEEYFQGGSWHKWHSENNSDYLLDIYILSGTTHLHIWKRSHLIFPAMLSNMPHVWRRDNESVSSWNKSMMRKLKTARLDSAGTSSDPVFLSL